MAANTAAGDRRARQGGFSYLLVLFWVAAGGVGLAALGTLWATARQHEDELELLYVGHQYRQAIGSYYQRGPGPTGGYPPTLDDLLKDPRTPAIARHLRRPYRDPITGSETWGLIQAPGGGIMGVRSTSSKRPRKTAGFTAEHAAFEDLAQLRGETLAYADWEFVFLPNAAATASNAGVRQ